MGSIEYNMKRKKMKIGDFVWYQGNYCKVLSFDKDTAVILLSGVRYSILISEIG